MVLPVLAVAVGAQAVSGIMQYYQAEKARGASEKRLKQIERMFDAIVPPDYDLKIWDDPKFAATVPEPAFNFDAITPEEYQNAGLLDFVQETSPTLVKATAIAKEGREAQLEALQRYKQTAAGEFDPQLQQMLNDASSRANREANSRNASIVQDANRRGISGAGLETAATMSASSNAMDQASRDSMMAAAEGYRNRLNAVDKSASLGGDIRDSEMNEEARNAGIINSFNQRTATRKQSVNQFNVEKAQAISDANVANRNKFTVDNVNRYNDLEGKQFDARRANRSDRMDVEDRKNRLKQQMYENLMAKVRGKTGIMESRNDLDMQGARDRNQAIRGVGDAVTSGALMYGKYGQRPPNAEPLPDYGTAKGSTNYAGYTPAGDGNTPAWADNQSHGGYTEYQDDEYDYDDWYRGQ